MIEDQDFTKLLSGDNSQAAIIQAIQQMNSNPSSEGFEEKYNSLSKKYHSLKKILIEMDDNYEDLVEEYEDLQEKYEELLQVSTPHLNSTNTQINI